MGGLTNLVSFIGGGGVRSFFRYLFSKLALCLFMRNLWPSARLCS